MLSTRLGDRFYRESERIIEARKLGEGLVGDGMTVWTGVDGREVCERSESSAKWISCWNLDVVDRWR